MKKSMLTSNTLRYTHALRNYHTHNAESVNTYAFVTQIRTRSDISHQAWQKEKKSANGNHNSSQ